MPFRYILPFLLLVASPALAADRTIYLTFDDGPLNGTSNILDVLQAQQVPATCSWSACMPRPTPPAGRSCSGRNRCRW
nr:MULTISPECIES: polysaccharide deacetylase family protein [unclassified Mesorhizobium]